MLTQKEVKKYLDYNPDTGIFKWKLQKSNNIKKGDKAGTLYNTGYTMIGINKKNYLAHRLAWLYVYGKFPKNGTDHINRNKSDNRIENLRDVNQLENMKNKSKYKNNKSGIIGVNWHKRDKKWMVQIQINNKKIHFGCFELKVDAIKVRKQAEIKYNFN